MREDKYDSKSGEEADEGANEDDDEAAVDADGAGEMDDAEGGWETVDGTSEEDKDKDEDETEDRVEGMKRVQCPTTAHSERRQSTARSTRTPELIRSRCSLGTP
jgi:hypothetical protein